MKHALSISLVKRYNAVRDTRRIRSTCDCALGWISSNSRKQVVRPGLKKRNNTAEQKGRKERTSLPGFFLLRVVIVSGCIVCVTTTPEVDSSPVIADLASTCERIESTGNRLTLVFRAGPFLVCASLCPLLGLFAYYTYPCRCSSWSKTGRMRDRTGTAFGASAHNESDIITTDTSGWYSATQLIPTKGYRSLADAGREENGRSRNGAPTKKSIFRNGRRDAEEVHTECLREKERCNQSS